MGGMVLHWGMVHVGIGYDVHQLVTGRPLFLGGVEIPHTKGLDGHSDADALMHAICDALLGAIGEEDIGHFFPNTDPRWRGVPSKIFLEEAARQIVARNGRIVNVDATVIAQAPKIYPHIALMKQRIAAARIDIDMTRLLCLKAADMMDKVGNKAAALEIAMIKVQAPNMALRIIDDAIQAHGGAGVSEDFGLAEAYAHQRTLRLADGPDEVHNRAIARIEFARHADKPGDKTDFSSGDLGVAR